MKTATKEKPILFSGEMVRAILAGTKTQTRRPVKPQPVASAVKCFPQDWIDSCPFGGPGDRLWVRETWRQILSGIHGGKADYRADDPSASGEGFIPWKPSIYMPRWASRLTLEIESVGVERIQEISEEDAQAEGKTGGCILCGLSSRCTPECGEPMLSKREAFEKSWNEIYPGSWNRNDWVWRLTFKVL